MFFCKEKKSLFWKMLMFCINDKIPTLMHWKLSWHRLGDVQVRMYRHSLILGILFDFLPDLVPAIFSIVKTWDFAIFNETCKDLIACHTCDPHFPSSPAILPGKPDSIAVQRLNDLLWARVLVLPLQRWCMAHRDLIASPARKSNNL